MSSDLVEIGEFIEIPGRGRGFVKDVSALWTVLDDPTDDHTNDKEIFINNREIVTGVLYRYPNHERFTEYISRIR